MQNDGGASPRDPDNAVARSEVWLGRVAVLLTGAALLATSAPEEYSYDYVQTLALPDVELTASSPSARLLVTARALELAPNGKPTTDDAEAFARGRLTQEGAARFVKVRAVGRDTSGGSELTVLKDFRLAAPLEFGGDCDMPGQGAPCEASFMIELEREDAGALGGSVFVSGSVELHARAPKDSGPNQSPPDFPWVVEVTEP